ncbi:hypothetical protein H257_14363 [Aphanomyces astaci]|uniref:Centrosomal protein of 162 kDa n=2 Tax=Aphanomyces astaci TaxID=112090 RepID=W4FR79_APHAT|nr:hypothetical protein H257_14363 [Aphanomyces astaci]ETV69995.1 hypothetical protein H257_14363 [Aphanomyces astaci]|eukprot:XP_009840438.1 hypothetical protein H257_14363 [Aphanomyces astaci]
MGFSKSIRLDNSKSKLLSPSPRKLQDDAMSSDEEFEKFLQGDSEDEQTAFAKTKKKVAKKKKHPPSSSKSKANDAKPAAATTTLDDSADPYNFDMAPPAFSRSSDEEELERQKAKKKKQSEKAPLVKKVSLEDRMADILKRHGSSMAESFAKPVEVVTPSDVPSLKADNEDESKNDAASEHAQSSSSSDSLGMESADFEVGGYAKKSSVPVKSAPPPSAILTKDQDDTTFRVNQPSVPPSSQTDRFRYAAASTEEHSDLDDHNEEVDYHHSVGTPASASPPELFSRPVEAEYATDEFEPSTAPTTQDNTLANTDLDKYDDDEFEDSEPPSPPPSPRHPDRLSPGPPPPPPPPPLTPTSIPVVAMPAFSLAALPDDLEPPPTLSFKYDLRSKVETIGSVDGVEDVSSPPLDRDQPAMEPASTDPNPPTLCTTQGKLEPAPSIVPPPPPPPCSTAAPFSMMMAAVPGSVVMATASNVVPQPETPCIAQNELERPSPPDHHQPTQSNTANEIAAKFHSLQTTLNQSNASVHTTDTHASIDKYHLRTPYSTKENQIKLQLQAAQREILALRHQLATSDQDVHTLSQARSHVVTSTSGGVHMTSQAWDALRKDMDSQEALIQGYQVENERLMHQLRDVRRDLQYDVHVTNQELQATIKDLRHQLDTQPPPPSGAHPLTAQLRAEGRVLELQDELHHVRKDHSRRERELKMELEQVKKAKVDVECRVGGVHMATLQQQNEAFEAFKRQSDINLHDAHAQITSLQSKLEWYVQNQRFIDDQDELVKQLQHSNEQLKEQLHHLTSTNKAKSHRPSSSTTDKRRIQTLEAQLKDMHVAMQKRHPDSLVNLILASKPDDVVAQLERQIQQLHDQRLEIEAQHEVKLTRFRQQHERVVQQLRQQLESKPNMDDESTESVATVRRFYLAKIKELERRLEQAKGQPPRQLDKASEPLTNTVVPSATLEQLREQHMERELALQRQLDDSENARRQLIHAFNLGNTTHPQGSNTTHPQDISAQVREKEAKDDQAHVAKAAMDALKDAHNAQMQQAKDIWHEELLHLSDKLSASQADCRKYADVAAQVPILEAAVQSLESRLSVPNTPSMLQYHALEMQIHTLTQKHAIRETELHVLLQNATQSSKMEVMQLQQRHEQAMAVKRAEIASFQAQLDEMLAELKRLHHQHP